MTAETASELSRILVVDDQAAIRLTLRGILSKRGYSVDIAESGVQALELARRTRYRLILMDIKMPDLSGVEAFVQLKSISPETTVIMMTAYAVEEEIQRAIREGAYAIVYKPFDMNKMFSIIDECLQGRTLILIVDDEVETASMLKPLFEQHGYQASVVSSGEECLKEVSQKHYQVIILDINLPGIDGIETLRRVKAVRPDIGVIMLSGHAKEETFKQALEEGSFACVRKPTDIEQLMKVIEQHMKK